MSLNKKHLQNFFKRLRHRVPKFTYYACGEYGDENKRPHYHANLFNFRLEDEQLIKRDDLGALFSSQTLDDVWGYGFTTIGEFSYDTAGYVARYILKKAMGTQSHDEYLRFNQETGELSLVEPEFQCQSCKPALGKTWFHEYKDDCYPLNRTPIPGKDCKVINGTPQYYDYLLKKEDQDLLLRSKEARQQFMAKNRSEFTPERLKAKYNVKRAQISTLRREL